MNVMNDFYNSNVTNTNLTAEEIIANDNATFAQWEREKQERVKYNNTQCNAHVIEYDNQLPF